MERDIVPRDFLFGEHGDLKAFVARAKVAHEFRCIEKVYLASIHDIDNSKQVADVDLGAGFLECFPVLLP